MKSVTVGLASLGGCLGMGTKDTDDDGVPDKSDYAPRDPAVQDKSDILTQTEESNQDESTEGGQTDSQPKIRCGEADPTDIQNALEVVSVNFEYECDFGEAHNSQMSVEIRNTSEMHFAFLSFSVSFYAKNGTGITSVNPFTGTPPSPGQTVVIDGFAKPRGCDTAADVVDAIDDGRFRITNVEDWNC